MNRIIGLIILISALGCSSKNQVPEVQRPSGKIHIGLLAFDQANGVELLAPYHVFK